MKSVIWFGVYVSPIVLMLLGAYTCYAMWRFIHEIDEEIILGEERNKESG